MSGEDRRAKLISVENSGPPELYTKISTKDPIEITGKTKDHLELYAWRRETILVCKYFGSCRLSKSEVYFRLVAKISGNKTSHHLMTSRVTKRIWNTIQTESGEVYTLGKEIAAKDALVL